VKCAGRSEPCTGGNVSHADDFDGRLNIIQAQCLANERVADFLQVGRLFQSGVFRRLAAAEPLVDAEVDVLIDGGRDDESTEAAVVGGQVGAASTDEILRGVRRDDHEDASVQLFNRRGVGKCL